MDIKGTLIIYTGGTIGMTAKSDSNISLSNRQEVIESIMDQLDLEAGDRIVGTRNIIDSSQLDNQAFNEITDIISHEHDCYDGFLIVNGTDTMAYLQSLLKWHVFGLKKPILITGAIDSYDRDEQEGLLNLRYALQQVRILRNRSIVAIAMNKQTLTGPTTKFNSTAKSPYIETIDSFIENLCLEKESNCRKLLIHSMTDAKIEIIYMNPCLFIPENENIADALIIVAYGQGTFKKDNALKERVKTYKRCNRTVIVISQCIFNSLDESLYEAGSFLDEFDVTFCRGSLLEEAIAYLHHLINNNILPTQDI